MGVGRYFCPDCGGAVFPHHVSEARSIAKVYVRGPSTVTTACTCDSKLAGYHATDCGVFK